MTQIDGHEAETLLDLTKEKKQFRIHEKKATDEQIQEIINILDPVNDTILPKKYDQIQISKIKSVLSEYSEHHVSKLHLSFQRMMKDYRANQLIQGSNDRMKKPLKGCTRTELINALCESQVFDPIPKYCMNQTQQVRYLIRTFLETFESFANAKTMIMFHPSLDSTNCLYALEKLPDVGFCGGRIHRGKFDNNRYNARKKRKLDLDAQSESEEGHGYGSNDSHSSIDKNQATGELENYEVNQILASRYNRKAKGMEFLVSWVGYSDEHNTWQPEESLKHLDIFIQFLKNAKKNKKN